jgi:GR25 family glycosyltransferase involved in LPS biosynthesis
MKKKIEYIRIVCILFLCFISLTGIYSIVKEQFTNESNDDTKLIRETYASPTIDTIWVINLKKDTKRLENFMKYQKYLPKTVQVWVGTNGKEEKRATAEKDGVPLSISESDDISKNESNPYVLKKPGVVGCWLSHKRLLQHLVTLDVNDSAGHYINEDDNEIPSNFMEKWITLKRDIPKEWDILFLGIINPHGKKINDSVIQWTFDKDDANWGTHSYIVRHGAIPYILKKLSKMTNAIDNQYNNVLKDLNIYTADPVLTSTVDLGGSTIDEMGARF